MTRDLGDSEVNQTLHDSFVRLTEDLDVLGSKKYGK